MIYITATVQSQAYYFERHLRQLFDLFAIFRILKTKSTDIKTGETLVNVHGVWERVR